ncbi:MAG: hypothetical protein WDN75_01575 [Bacteroidota bacterium]
MRKFFSILFIVLILLNIVGYYGLFLGLEYRNNRAMMQKLDIDDYSPSETVILKIPIAIPYVSDSPSFERVNGHFHYEGEFYRLVKQRLSGDTLHVICIKDVKDKQIQGALARYAETFTDRPADNSTSSKAIFDAGKDYFSPVFSLDHLSSGWSGDVRLSTSFLNISSIFCASIVHPPERIFFI